MRPTASACTVVAPTGLQSLIEQLITAGYTVIGPTVADAAVVYQPLTSVAQLPVGVSDEQSGGRYRLVPAGRPALFDTVVGPQSWKRWLYPPRQRLWRAVADENGFRVEAQDLTEVETGAETDGDARVTQPLRYAFLGVRPCEIKAMQLQDRIFDRDGFHDPGYQARRAEALIIAVNCARPAATCFCRELDSGPRATGGYDLAITELFDGDDHRLLIEAGSDRGEALLPALRAFPGRPATGDDRDAARAVSRDTAAAMTRRMPPDVAGLLQRNQQHPHWDAIAARCLNCGNCTLVCPTCFCTTTVDSSDLDGRVAERWREWDSCFTADFSYLHGGSVRRSGRSRYRQWMSHKLAYWHQQFGSSGCVGCGRCITWCPVGIDITEEARAFAAFEGEAVPEEQT